MEAGVSSRTQFVYDLLQQLVDELEITITAAKINIDVYRRLLEKKELSRDEQKKLVPVFKLFTPTHLLKQPFASDSNELNKAFYRELLYIMGLKEYKEKGTHYITRLDEVNRHHASLIENSDLIDFFYRNISSRYRGGYLRFIFNRKSNFMVKESVYVCQAPRRERYCAKSLCNNEIIMTY